MKIDSVNCYFIHLEREDPLVEWDYLPMMGARTARGFVGLKNAGATCYMNSVLQQLYMVLPIRLGILSAHGAAIDANDDFNVDEKNDNEVLVLLHICYFNNCFNKHILNHIYLN